MANHVELRKKVAAAEGWENLRVAGGVLVGTEPYSKEDGLRPPLYTSNMTDAWALVEKIGPAGWGLINDDQGHWAFVGDGMQNLREFVTQPLATTYFLEEAIWCDTPEEAICEAFLHSVSS